MKSNHLIPLLLFFIGFTLYMATLCPGVFVGDSGELATASWFVGIPHSTGFPTYINASKIGGYLPFGNIAYRLNVVSAFFAACGILVPFYILKQMKLPVPACVMGSLLLAVNQNFWSQAIITRVYTLSNFLLFSTIYLLFRAINNRDVRFMFFGLFLFGLALNTHGGILGSTPVIGFLVIYGFWKNKIWIQRSIAPMVLFTMAGLTVILFIMIRGQHLPFPTWHYIHKYKYFLDYITHSEYDFKLMKRSIPEMFEYVKMVGSRLSWEWLPVLFFIATLNLIIIAWKNLVVGVALALLACSNIALMVLYGTESDMLIAKRFFIPTHFVVATSLGFFFHTIFKKLLYKKYTIFLFIFPVVLLIINYSFLSLKYSYLTYEYNSFILKQCPPNAVLFHLGDNVSFPVWYLKHVERLRPDLLEITVSLVNTGSYGQLLRKVVFKKLEHKKRIINLAQLYDDLLGFLFNNYPVAYSTYRQGLKVPSDRYFNQFGLLTVISKKNKLNLPYSSVDYPWTIPPGGWKTYLGFDDVEINQLARNVILTLNTMIYEGMLNNDSVKIKFAKTKIEELVPGRVRR